MTSERDFDRLARAWLEQGPNEAPDRVIAAVLQAADTVPQVRRRVAWPTRRHVQMNRLLLLAGAAVLLVAVIGGGALIGGSKNVAVSVTPAPTTVPSPSTAPSVAVPAPVPSAIQSTWVGAPRSIAGLLASARYRLELTPNTFRFPFDDVVQGQLLANASTEDGDVLRLSSISTPGGCQVGDVGTYRWSLSPSGTRLTFTVVNDACAARRAALPGDWQRVACKNTDSACFGDLVEAGTYPSQYYAPRLPADGSWQPDWGALTYTVPAGWANSADWPNSFVLTPSDAYANEGPDGPRDGTVREIGAFRLPVAVSQDAACVGPTVPSGPTSIDGLIGYVRGLKSVVASAPTSITIDGRPAKWMDVTIAPTWKTSCPDVSSGEPVALLLRSGSAIADEHVIGLTGPEKIRLVFADVGGQVALVVIDSRDPARFDDLATQAMPIIESFTFK
jgi:hypothetical protein